MKDKTNKIRRKLWMRMIMALIIIAIIAFSPGLLLVITSGIWALCTIYPSGYVYVAAITIAVIIKLLINMVKHMMKNKKEELS